MDGDRALVCVLGSKFGLAGTKFGSGALPCIVQTIEAAAKRMRG